MRAYLAQHGLAMDKSEDPARPLSAQGREDVTRCAGFLSLFERPRPNRILHSGKLRARQTAEMFAEAWHIADVEESEGLQPGDDPGIWLSHLRHASEDLMLVGHLPHLERLAARMLGTDSPPLRMRNGGVVCLERSNDGWQILWFIHPLLFYRTGN